MKQKGFTLIELIIVIVILGILAVTAAPKFIDIQSDATASTLQGAKAAMQGGAQLVYAKAAIAGVQNQAADGNGAPTVSISNTNVSLDNGYPDADEVTGLADISPWVDLPDSDWDFTAAGADDVPVGSFGIYPEGVTPDFDAVGDASCHVLYTNSGGNGAAPVITVVSGSC
ncbi:prepilin-type N-terminal cleavage/methylation domain-containing protein [Lacimicrobium alkaliphilum]|uniref:MSHA biogenesis protein MshA n=1 Tax=Lacimicrobium alkaliphilum TaxID=1526571 RepID=A0A0U2ZF00_9ALTE|nr:prepilin-type N-terminal cleavage/methylation domain-containing protein [Lacimicrobium alkaliphilum]ALS97004.1 hypothetical protein AT746_01060 [Lacimicrobium alkaliphilum]